MEKYIYIDDDPQQHIAQGFLKEGELIVDGRQPDSSWEKQLMFLRQEADSIDGLILDLRLDETPNSTDKTTSDFRGTSLAQEIRTRQKESNMKSFPIILMSANEKINNSLENSGLDLFDIKLSKEISVEDYTTIRKQFVSLSNCYEGLSKSFNVNLILGIANEGEIDAAFLSELNGLRDSPVHVKAHFLLNEFIQKAGLLVPENILAARLGIDKDSSPDWTSLLGIIEDTKYTGFLSDGWPRWWMYRVDNWWRKGLDDNLYLRSTSAEERVNIIKEKTGLHNIIAAKKLEKAHSAFFWTICKGYDKPLDPVDGLVIKGQDNLYTWQDMEYVSIEAALNREKISEWKGVAAIDDERYNYYKTYYSQSR